jgi:hypothetical protein
LPAANLYTWSVPLPHNAPLLKKMAYLISIVEIQEVIREGG